MFSFDPLIPRHDDWPVFDEVVMCTFSPFSSSSSSSSSPLVSALADMPVPPSRASLRNKNPDHIPRPRNAFMLFRSAFAAADKISASIEHDNRHITRIIAHCWNRLPDAEKQIWRDKAAAEKAQHAERYPNYRFSPVGRAKKAKKRRVRRNGEKDVKRCAAVADLVMAGKCGLELERAMNVIDAEGRPDGTELDAFACGEMHGMLFKLDPPPQDPGPCGVQPFRSPLLPPPETTGRRASDENVVTQPFAIATVHCDHLEPRTPAGTGTSTLCDDLKSLFYSPCHQPSPRPIPPAHYQSVMTFAQNDQSDHQSVLDYSILAWNQSDSFSYYH